MCTCLIDEEKRNEDLEREESKRKKQFEKQMKANRIVKPKFVNVSHIKTPHDTYAMASNLNNKNRNGNIVILQTPHNNNQNAIENHNEGSNDTCTENTNTNINTDQEIRFVNEVDDHKNLNDNTNKNSINTNYKMQLHGSFAPSTIGTRSPTNERIDHMHNNNKPKQSSSKRSSISKISINKLVARARNNLTPTSGNGGHDVSATLASHMDDHSLMAPAQLKLHVHSVPMDGYKYNNHNNNNNNTNNNNNLYNNNYNNYASDRYQTQSENRKIAKRFKTIDDSDKIDNGSGNYNSNNNDNDNIVNLRHHSSQLSDSVMPSHVHQVSTDVSSLFGAVSDDNYNDPSKHALTEPMKKMGDMSQITGLPLFIRYISASNDNHNAYKGDMSNVDKGKM